jgi:mxaJ protein
MKLSLPVIPLLLSCLCLAGSTTMERRELRVCSDPNNLPFSNREGAGYENKIAELLARELSATLRYTWWPQRRGFLRNTLNAGRCDVVIGFPTADPMVLATRPYYRSTYVFLSRRDRHLQIHSLDDPALRRLTIGLHFIGDDYHNTPPAQALARRGIVDQVVGYSIYGNYADPNPPARLVDAVAKGEVDIAIIWGPFAGYFGAREPVPLTLTPVTPVFDPPGLPFTFEISMGVRKADVELRSELDRVLDRRRTDVQRVLRRYGVPLVGSPTLASTRPCGPKACQ